MLTVVPDLDRLPRGLRPAWRAVADAFRGQQPPQVSADAIEKALARTLRHAGGLQWLPGLAEALASCGEKGSLSPLEEYTAKLERSRATGVGSAFVDAAWTLAGGDNPPRDVASSTDLLMQSGLQRMVDKLCVGPLEPELVPSVFASPRELATYVEECMAETQFVRLARQLAQTGCTGKVRAPRTRLLRRGTKGLLYEGIK
jgi:hypothetical protein